MHRVKNIEKPAAIDPAIDTFVCGCGKPTCLFSRLHPFRDHIAELYRVISACETEGCFEGESWNAVLYSLQMAASIQDVNADTGYVDNTQSVMFCSRAAEYENKKSDVACKYVAAFSIFTFLWAAYAGAVERALPNELKRLSAEGKFGERARRPFGDAYQKFR